MYPLTTPCGNGARHHSASSVITLVIFPITGRWPRRPPRLLRRGRRLAGRQHPSQQLWPAADPTQPIVDWQAALGDRRRGGHWFDLFRGELADRPWREVLQTWWPRLLPGCAGSLTHGLIRAAHAVRSLREAAQPSELQIDELACGLRFWATVFAPPTTEPGEGGDLGAATVDRALSELTAEYAGHYAATKPSFPIPLIHTITAPAAIRLLLPELPDELHAVSLRTIAQVNRELFARFGGQHASGNNELAEPATDRTFISLAAEALDIGDEHAIKICEAASREYAVRPGQPIPKRNRYRTEPDSQPVGR